MTTVSNRLTVFILVVAISVLGYSAWKAVSSSDSIGRLLGMSHHKSSRHVYDNAGVLPQQDLPRFEQYMNWIMEESDVDVRFVFVKGTGEKTMEQLAVDTVDEMRIGGKTGEQRGLLLFYDTVGKCLKVEVGYGLEEYFPDGFISYLVNRHARMFFESGDKSLGLRLLLRILQQRIREAVLGDAFDPRVLETLSEKGNLSGGAGVSATMHDGGSSKTPSGLILGEAERGLYIAQGSPTETYNLYLKWLSQPVYDPNIDIFTEDSRHYMSGLPMSPAYLDFILFGEYGKNYRVVERQGLAILYFTGTPFASPHFFINENGVWRMDIVAEVQNTHNIVGGIYDWTYAGGSDRYSQAFSDLLISIKGYRRFKDGDNRALVIRGSRNL